MSSKIIFGKWEGTVLLINLICTQIILGFPRVMTEMAGTAAWITIIYVSVIMLVAFWLISKLYSRFEGMDIIDISQIAGGGILRVITGLVMTAYIMYIISIVLREFAEDMKVIILPESPISFVTLFFVAGMIVGAYLGLEAIVRLGAIFIPLITIGFLFITIGVSPYYDMANLFPVLGAGPEKIFGEGFFRISIFSAASILFFIAPYIRTNRNFKIVGYASILISSCLFLWSVLSYIMVFPYTVSIENFLPIYQMARLINYGRFFQRVESVFVFIWAATALLYLSGAFYFIIHIFRKTFKLEYEKPLIAPFAILIFNISLLPPNLATAIQLEEEYFRKYIWIVTIVFPIIVLSIANISQKRKKGERKGEKAVE
ncbi:spore germination protein (amino acid permease) [Anaerobacterium chartisolvens]|uniref:Spore germination protein (Amino acid permease) n=1 Tax=Anaerobacterium chartisolvens TaxID=1297424 RepID=A0A369BG27_9FIRM|nr:endospore germination permease [Anaerobacterium chartisolvens]RCX19427.1 spore germination protein (amino acid permease) [Anaerobacterium chartisolvens]